MVSSSTKALYILELCHSPPVCGLYLSSLSENGCQISTQLILTWRYPKEKAGGQRQKAFLFTCLSLIRKEWKFFPRNLKNSILYISLDEIGSNVHPVSKEEEGLVVGEATRSICSITYLHMVFYSYAYVVDNVPNYEQQKMFLTDLTRKWLYS